MFKILSLIVAGILSASSGVYLISIIGFPVLQLPNVNWVIVGFVLIVASAVSFGTAFVTSRLK